MRRFVTTLALGALVAACGGEDATSAPPQTPAAPTPPAPVATADMPAPPAPADTTAAAAPAPSLAEKIQATMQAMGAASQAHDADKIAALYTDNAVIKAAGMPDTTGREAIASIWKERFSGIPDAKTAPRRIFLKDDVAVVELTLNGTNTGPGPMGMKPTGKPVGVNFLVIQWFDQDGKIKEQHDYFDMGTFMAQIGMAPPGTKARPLATLPAGAPEVHVAKGSPDEQANVAKVKAVDTAFDSHDEKTVSDSTADDVAWDDQQAPAPTKGKDPMLKMMRDGAKAFPDMKGDCQQWGFDDYVVQECTMTGTNKGPLVMGPKKLPATNKSVTAHGVDVIHLKDGKAIEGWSYGNSMEWAMQLGLMKPPGAPKADAKGAAPKGDATKKSDKAPAKGDVSKAPKK